MSKLVFQFPKYSPYRKYMQEEAEKPPLIGMTTSYFNRLTPSQKARIKALMEGKK